MKIRTHLAFSLLLTSGPALHAQTVAPAPSSPTVGIAASEFQTTLRRLNDASGIVSVRYVMEPPFTEHTAALSARQLREWGCNYGSRDPVFAWKVALLLRSAALHVASVSDSRELRQLLDIEFSDGSTMVLQFGEVFSSDNLFHGSINGMPFTANKELQGDLFRWAQQFSDQPPACRYFLEHYK